MKKLIFLAFFLNLALIGTSCGGNMNELLTKSEFSKKWDAMQMNSSEFWWYAGSQDNLHFIAIETPFQTNIYSVQDTEIKIKGLDKKEFSSSKENWIVIKVNNIEVMH